jgi:acyl dehydratase
MAGLAAAVGCELGVSDWHEVRQDGVDAFAQATGDDYWIHTDPVRAAAGPMGSTIAHGLYTLALGPMFTGSIVQFGGFSMILNYGYDRVRFPAPLPVGSCLRMRSALIALDATRTGAQATLRQTFECAGSDKPVCVADSVLRLVS